MSDFDAAPTVSYSRPSHATNPTMTRTGSFTFTPHPAYRVPPTPKPAHPDEQLPGRTSRSYAFVVRRKDDPTRWVPVRVTGGDMDVGGTGSYFSEVTDELRSLWRRVASDQTIRWDDSHHEVGSMRLVRLDVRVTEADDELHPGGLDRVSHLRATALAKLTGEEIRALKLEVDCVKVKMMASEPDPDEDNRLLCYGISSASRTMFNYDCLQLADDDELPLTI